MTRVVIWKELREQFAVVAVLVVMGCGLMIAMATLLDPQQFSGNLDAQSFRNYALVGAVMLTVAAGLVIGATLFAGEHEAGTATFLDRLPGSRGRIWWRKIVAGAFLATVPAAAFFLASRATGLMTGQYADGQAALLFGTVMVLAFVWGTFGSVVMRTSLGAAAVGLGMAVLTLVLLYVVAALLVTVVSEMGDGAWRRSVLRNTQTFGAFVGLLAMVVLPLAASAFVYTAPDRDRWIGGVVRLPTLSGEMKTVRFALPRIRLGAGGPVPRTRRLLWLLTRQLRVPAAWLVGFALLAGFGLLLPTAVALVTWPAVGLVVGLMLGVTLFGDEQGSEANLFWGERRLAVGKLWRAKVVWGGAMLVLLVVVMALPSFGRTAFESRSGELPMGHGFHRMLAGNHFPPVGFVLLGPVYGFVFGILSRLVFRKAIVAGAVGLTVGGTAAALWMPSVVSGGVSGWQLWAVPVVVLVTSRLLVWPWATARVASRPALLRLAIGLTTAVAVLAVGIGYRVVEVPVSPQANDDVAFAESLPTFDDKQSGRDVRRAVSQFTGLLKPSSKTLLATMEEVTKLTRSLDDSFERGPDDRDWKRIDALLAQFPAGEWEAALAESATKPTGVYIDPNEYNIGTFRAANDSLATFGPMTRLYLLRGLQAQRDGNAADFPDRLRVVLSVVNTTRQSGPLQAVISAAVAEADAFRALDLWLAGLRGEPKLLRQVLKVLQDHERAVETGFHVERTVFAEQTILRNSLDTPTQWLPRLLGNLPHTKEPSDADNLQAEVIGFLWAVPWERERLVRAIGFNNGPDAPNFAGYLTGVPGLEFQAGQVSLARLRLQRVRPLPITLTRAHATIIAVRLFETDRGRFPATLDELVPEYLPVVPLDPFAPAGPLVYRIAAAAESIGVDPGRFFNVPVPADPLGEIGTGTGMTGGPGNGGTAFPYTAVAHGVASLAGSVVFLNAPAPLVEPDGTASTGGWYYPSAIPTTRQESNAIRVAAGQPMVWSVGPDGQGNGGRTHDAALFNRGVLGYVDLVYPVPLPAPRR